MWAMKTVPEVKTKIESGSMSMTTVAQVQVFLRQERTQGIKRSDSDRRDVFNKFENKTSKEVKKEIQELKGDRIRAKLTLELDEEAENMWMEVRARSAHQTQGDELRCFKLLMREYLHKKPQRA